MPAKERKKTTGGAGKFKPHRMIRISEYLASRLELAAKKHNVTMSSLARDGIRCVIIDSGITVKPEE